MEKLLVPPHGGELKPLLLTGDELIEEKKRAEGYRQVRLSSRETSDLIMLGIGAFSPLDGFMRQRDYIGVVENMHLFDGTLWPIPITLSVPKELAGEISIGSSLALIDDESEELMGTMVVEEKYEYDKKKEARLVFRTEDEAHPGVAKVYAQHQVYLGGPVKVLSEGPYPEQFGDYYARPAQTRELFIKHGWKTIAAFQTRNPIHRSHEYCTKIAMEICDGVLIHPLVGKLKEGDIPADVRMECYKVLLKNYYPADRVELKVYPMEMRYGGPREAVLHAIFRQNYGCSHLIIGRDHAGVGNYYGPFDAQKIFEEIDDHELHIKPLMIDWTFWCHKCDGMASMKTCPHGKEDRVLISGTKLREMLARGEMPPKEFSRPEVAQILSDYYKSLNSESEKGN
ncbi:MAG: sulfate adenylyltransferase [Calditrichia bacterium]